MKAQVAAQAACRPAGGGRRRSAAIGAKVQRVATALRGEVTGTGWRTVQLEFDIVGSPLGLGHHLAVVDGGAIFFPRVEVAARPRRSFNLGVDRAEGMRVQAERFLILAVGVFGSRAHLLRRVRILNSTATRPLGSVELNVSTCLPQRPSHSRVPICSLVRLGARGMKGHSAESEAMTR